MTARRTGPPARKAARATKAKAAKAASSQKKTGKKAPKPESTTKRAAKKTPAPKSSSPSTRKKTTQKKGSASPMQRGASAKAQRPPASLRIVATLPVSLGRVERAFPRKGVLVLTLGDTLREGDWIAVRGPTSDLVVPVKGIRRNDRRVKEGREGQIVSVSIGAGTRPGDHVERLDP